VSRLPSPRNNTRIATGRNSPIALPCWAQGNEVVISGRVGMMQVCRHANYTSIVETAQGREYPEAASAVFGWGLNAPMYWQEALALLTVLHNRPCRNDMVCRRNCRRYQYHYLRSGCPGLHHCPAYAACRQRAHASKGSAS